MFTASEVKEIKNMLENGMTQRNIAKKLGCSDVTISRINRGEFEPIELKRVCEVCEKTFESRHRTQKLCGRKECRKEKERQHNAKASAKRRKTTKQKARTIREYTYTSNMMIVADMERGYSLEYMARAYDRDRDDLRKHISQIKNDGTAEKIKKRLEVYQENQKIAVLGGWK